METERAHINSYLQRPGEIDFFYLLTGLWKKKVMILIITLIFTLIGIGYALFKQDVYRVEVRLFPPHGASLSGLTISGIEQLDGLEQYAFDLTNRMLGAKSIEKKLFADPKISEYLKQHYPARPKLSISLPDKKKKIEYTKVYLEWSEPRQAEEIINKWVKLALLDAKSQLVDDAKSELKEKKDDIKNKIQAKKRLALTQIERELLKLIEAKAIADLNGMSKPVNLSTENIVSERSEFSNVMELRSLYLLGSEALSAEIEALEKRRENPELYVSYPSGLEEELEGLEGSSLNFDYIDAAVVDAWAAAPKNKIKPNRVLVVFVSFLAGAVFAIFVATMSLLLKEQ